MRHVFIGLPVYNGEDYLAAALESLLAQTHHDFTVLIADNASTDATQKIARGFAAIDTRIRYHRHDFNLGAAPNFNFCLEKAEGDYFKWMAHDDLLEVDYLKACVELLEHDAGAVLAHAQVTCIDDDGAITGFYDTERDFNGSDPVDRFARAMALTHGCVTLFGLIRLNVLRCTPAIAPFVGSDRPLLAELALRGRLEYVPRRLFLWRDHKKRSVHQNRRQRAAWFNTSARSMFAGLYLQQIWANFGAIFRVPLSLRNRCRAGGRVFLWVGSNHRRLIRDIRAMGGALLRVVFP